MINDKRLLARMFPRDSSTGDFLVMGADAMRTDNASQQQVHRVLFALANFFFNFVICPVAARNSAHISGVTWPFAFATSNTLRLSIIDWAPSDNSRSSWPVRIILRSNARLLIWYMVCGILMPTPCVLGTIPESLKS